MTPYSFQTLDLSKNIQVSFIGPSLDQGPLPAIFYFALSAKESLLIDPFNQPVVRLSQHRVRIFSMDLPFHGAHFLATDALTKWAEEIKKNRDPISAFLDQVSYTVNALIDQNIALKNKIAVMGLSRGGFIACHAAARLSFIQTILGFAPLTQLLYAKEFKELQNHSIPQSLELKHLIDQLYARKLRFYIGNRDTRVGTSICFKFIESLVEKAYLERIRSPQIELFLVPSIGHLGHGTSKQSFISGADWVMNQLTEES